VTVKIGITGLGRIGRCVIRSWIESGRDDVEVVAVNYRQNTPEKVHLLQYDSTHGTLSQQVTAEGDEAIVIGDKRIKVLNYSNPADIPWGDVGVDVVLECTGVFKKHADASKHLIGGAKKVLISAPSPDPDSMVVYGVNNEVVKPEHQVISIGSCTTNCLAPVAKILNDEFGIVAGFMTTVHAYTNDQNVLDGGHKDLRRARTCAASMIPTSTGAAKALGQVLPELDGKLDGTAVRVPTPNVSLVDLAFTAEKSTSVEAINAAIKSASQGKMKGVLGYNEAPLVSIDFNHNPHSSVFDATQTYKVGDNLYRVATWYDNEWGFSCRMLDVAALVG